MVTYEELVKMLRAKAAADQNARWAVAVVFLVGEQKTSRDRARFLPHCDVTTSQVIDWQAVLDEGTWSSTEKLMLRAAGHLAGDDVEIDLKAAMDKLDDRQSGVLDAMLLARHTATVPEQYR
jgi:hypothetical protein